MSAFESFEQHHLIFTRAGYQLFGFTQVGHQRLFANHMLFMAEEQQRLLAVKGVGAGDVNRIDGIRLGQCFKGIEKQADVVVGAKFLRFFQPARIDGGQFQLAAFVRGVDKAFRNPVGAHNGKANHRYLRFPGAVPYALHASHRVERIRLSRHLQKANLAMHTDRQTRRGGSDTAGCRTPTDGNWVPYGSTGCRRPCCGLSLSDAPTHVPRSCAKTAQAPA